MFFIAPFLAHGFSGTIITYPDSITAPLKVPFDTTSVLGRKCVNHNLKVMVTASNTQKTVAQFDYVQLYGKDGLLIDNNVANKTDALSITPYSLYISMELFDLS